jgi:hypothetical protein
MTKYCKDGWERGGKKHVLDTYERLHKGKIGMHWMWAAILRVTHAGESEQSAMEDFGYRYEGEKSPTPPTTEQERNAVLFEVAMTTLRQIASTPRNRKARVNASATVHFIEAQSAEIAARL